MDDNLCTKYTLKWRWDESFVVIDIFSMVPLPCFGCHNLNIGSSCVGRYISMVPWNPKKKTTLLQSGENDWIAVEKKKKLMKQPKREEKKKKHIAKAIDNLRQYKYNKPIIITSVFAQRTSHETMNEVTKKKKSLFLTLTQQQIQTNCLSSFRLWHTNWFFAEIYV